MLHAWGTWRQSARQARHETELMERVMRRLLNIERSMAFRVWREEAAAAWVTEQEAEAARLAAVWANVSDKVDLL